MRPAPELTGLLGLTTAAGTTSRRLPQGGHRDGRRRRHRRPTRSSSTAPPTATRCRRRAPSRSPRCTPTPPRRPPSRRSPCAASAQRAARRPRSPTTCRGPSSRPDRATPPGPARSVTVSRRSAPTTCSSAAADDRLGQPGQGRHPAGRRAAATARQPDPGDEPRQEAAAAVLVLPGRPQGGRRRRRVTTTATVAPRDGSTSTCREQPGRLLGRATGPARGSAPTSTRAPRCRTRSRGLHEPGLRGRRPRDAPTAATSRRRRSRRPTRTQLAQWRSNYPSLPSPVTNRSHCIAWSDWSSQPKVELANGMRLDTNYYYWPGSWVQNRPGFMTGSGMPMRFADPTARCSTSTRRPRR